MRGILYNAKSHGKHLVVVHHARDEYKPMPQRDGSLASGATGKRERAGFSTLGDSADVIVHNYTESTPELDPSGKQIMINGKLVTKLVPYCKVDLAEALPLIGMVFKEPTFDLISRAIKMIKGTVT